MARRGIVFGAGLGVDEFDARAGDAGLGRVLHHAGHRSGAHLGRDPYPGTGSQEEDQSAHEPELLHDHRAANHRDSAGISCASPLFFPCIAEELNSAAKDLISLASCNGTSLLMVATKSS